jgi:hypothetical protein
MDDNFKMDIRQMGWEGVDCIELSEDRDEWRALLTR